MSQRSESPASDRLDASSLNLSETSSNFDMDSDYSRDINLNSKKFADSNLVGTDIKVNFDDRTTELENLNAKFHMDYNKNGGFVVDQETVVMEVKNNNEGTTHHTENKKTTVSLTGCSTPKPESVDSQALCNLFPPSAHTSIVSEIGAQTYVVNESPNQNSNSLSNEEIGKKFQDLSFAYKTDSLTIQKRLELMKRKRDQAENNIENELRIIKGKLKTLLFMGLNSEFVNVMTELANQLDFVHNATLQLSSSAESYGYAQHEDKLLDLIGVMLKHVENVESSKSEISKASDKLKEVINRSLGVSPNASCDDERILRRRSITPTVERNSRRRASIATLPRMSHSENGCNGKGLFWTPNRPTNNLAKKLSFSQGSSRSQTNGQTAIDDTRRDSISVRHRRESKTSESSMKNIDEELQSSSIESEFIDEPISSDLNSKLSDSSLHLKQLFDSFEEISYSSNATESITFKYCVSRLAEWHKFLFGFLRFRWPDNLVQFVPFYVTWYVVFLLTFVFIGGFLTGINCCYVYSYLKYSALGFLASAFFSFARRFYRIFLLLSLTLVFVLTLFWFWLTKILLPLLTNEEIDALFLAFGFEIRYLNGPPPV